MPSIAWLLFSARCDFVSVCLCGSRLLLLLAAVEVITMPLTQHLWTWDGFLRGGRDFELGLLMIVTFLCFVLLRAQQSRQRLGSLLAIGVSPLRFVSSGKRCWKRDARRSGHDKENLCCSPAVIPLLI